VARRERIGIEAGGNVEGCAHAWPSSRYQAFLRLGARFADFKVEVSIRCVPLSSPRLADADPCRGDARQCLTGARQPLMPAGSDLGPTMMKSLCITSRRSTPYAAGHEPVLRRRGHAQERIGISAFANRKSLAVPTAKRRER